MTLEVEDLIHAEVFMKFARRNVLGMEHAAVEDRQAIWFHIDAIQQFPIVIPSIDVRVLFHGIFRPEEDRIREFGISFRRAQRRRGESAALSKTGQIGGDASGQMREPGWAVPVQACPSAAHLLRIKYTMAVTP